MIRKFSFGAVILAIGLCCASLCPALTIEEQRLFDAAKNGSVSDALSLLEKGISPKTKDELGRTPLHCAAAQGHQATAEAFLRYGADINGLDNDGKTPLDLAEIGGHSGLAEFLRGKGGVRKSDIGGSDPRATPPDETSATMPMSHPRMLNPSLKFKSVPEFEKEIGEPAVLLDSVNLSFFVPSRREKEATIIFGYLVKAYDALYEIVGVHTDFKIAVYAFPKGNPHGWGGTSEYSIAYDDSNLDLARWPEWTKYSVPHVSGYIEEMAHNFVHSTKAQFGWEMMGWSLGTEVSLKVAGNPILAGEIRATRQGQKQTFAEYVRNGYVFPKELPSNQCDRIHAWILFQCKSKYGPRFWNDFFREVRTHKQALTDAVQTGDADSIRNARYRITIACFDRLPGLEFKKTLQNNQISLTTDVKTLRPEAPEWNRRLIEAPRQPD